MHRRLSFAIFVSGMFFEEGWSMYSTVVFWPALLHLPFRTKAFDSTLYYRQYITHWWWRM